MKGMNVFPIKVKDVSKPWIEICKKSAEDSYEPRNIIMIEAVVGSDPLDLEESPKKNKILDSNQIYGNYNIEVISDFGEIIKNNNGYDVTPSIIKISIACLKNSSSLKHVHMSTFTALSNLFHNINDFNIKESHYFPYILINTRCNESIAPRNSFSEMIREATAVYINNYGVYPNIFVAFSDDDLLTDEKPKKKKKKKKNKKK